jgi:hypothetical protein
MSIATHREPDGLALVDAHALAVPAAAHRVVQAVAVHRLGALGSNQLPAVRERRILPVQRGIRRQGLELRRGRGGPALEVLGSPYICNTWAS